MVTVANKITIAVTDYDPAVRRPFCSALPSNPLSGVISALRSPSLSRHRPLLPVPSFFLLITPWTGTPPPHPTLPQQPLPPHPIRPSRRRGRGCHGPAVGAMVTVGIRIRSLRVKFGRTCRGLQRSRARCGAAAGGRTGAAPSRPARRGRTCDGAPLVKGLKNGLMKNRRVSGGWPVDWSRLAAVTGQRKAAGQGVGHMDQRFQRSGRWSTGGPPAKW